MEDIVKIVPYDPAWPRRYREERAAIHSVLGSEIAAFEHTGSTAVVGLAAKPTTDIMVGVQKLKMDDKTISAVSGLGYRYLGEYGIPGRHFFRKGTPPTHHIHWVEHFGDFWEKQILFRDFIRSHPEEARDYERLKRDLASKHRHDRKSYTSSKGGFIDAILAKAKGWDAGSNWIVVDLETTCWEVGTETERQEIIEIGAVRLERPGLAIPERFSRFVRPKDDPIITDFCRKLTSIAQEDVDKAPPFPAALSEFLTWAGRKPFRLASWGMFDLEQLERECLRHKIPMPPVLLRHIDIRGLFAQRRGIEPCRMTEALGMLKIPLEGTLHRGVDDAENGAKLARVLLQDA